MDREFKVTKRQMQKYCADKASELTGWKLDYEMWAEMSDTQPGRERILTDLTAKIAAREQDVQLWKRMGWL